MLLFLLAAQTGSDAMVYFVSDSEGDSKQSLRGAVSDANCRGGYNVIFLRAKHYILKAKGNPAFGQSGDLDITTGRLMIWSIGEPAVISGEFQTRIFHVHRGARLTLRNVEIQNGVASEVLTVPHAHDGGGLLNQGELLMLNCRVSNSNAGLPWFLYRAWGEPGQGGGICNLGRLQMSSCEMWNNSSAPSGYAGAGGRGGALFNSGTAVLRECTIRNNTAGFTTEAVTYGVFPPSGFGGGIYNTGRMLIQSSTIASNATPKGRDASSSWEPPFSNVTGALPGGDGAGVWNSGRLQLVLCTITGNICGAGGRGLNQFIGREAAAGGNGGGIYNSGTMMVTSSTIVLNRAGSGGPGSHIRSYPLPPAGGDSGGGGGIFCSPGAVSRFRNTLIALNRAGEPGPGGSTTYWSNGRDVTVVGLPGHHGCASDLYCEIAELKWCLLGIAENPDALGAMPGNLFGTGNDSLDPLISSLGDHGGSTWTHLPLPGSPALDAGRAFELRTDQRGNDRVRNLPNVKNAWGSDGSDIGAVEFGK